MSSDLQSRIQVDLTCARKQRDKALTVLLSMTLSELRNREIAERRELTQDEVIEVVTRAVKQRKEAAEQMRAGGRPELAEKEEREADVLTAYLPEPLTEEAVRGIVREVIAAGASSMGPLMGQLMPRIKGRFDGREANRIVREELGA